MATEDEKLSLKVTEAPQKDVGRGLVRIDPLDLEKAGGGIGDVILHLHHHVLVNPAQAIPAISVVLRHDTAIR